MKVLFVSSECYPLVKTGGLADVVGALPLALRASGVEARVLLPCYPGVAVSVSGERRVATWPDLFGGPASLIACRAATGLELLLLDAPHLFDRAGGGPYLGPDGRDWPDNHLRFGALSRAAADVSLGAAEWVAGEEWKPDVVHLHDWQAALTAAYLHYDKGDPRRVPPSLLTIHNLAFQGLFTPSVAESLGLPVNAAAYDAMEFWGNLSFLKAGVLWCDHLSTVSPTYAAEILTEANGMGFDGLLRERASELTGIVNGIDDELWNPGTDRTLVPPYQQYSGRRVAGKAVCKAALQVELGLHVRTNVPLFCVVSRLTSQKGIDLLARVMPAVLQRGAQFAVLGTGDRELEDAVRRVAEQHPGEVAAVIGYDEDLSHRMQAGSDAIVVPSRFEPCGLTQLYGLRYGTLPVVARVGGLADTVIDANEAALRDGVATGFQFTPVEAGPLQHALLRACDLFDDQPRWQQLQRRAMGREVGWSAAAERYVSLYERMLRERAR